MKIGILGGAFDPVHDGHLALARAAREGHGLDRVLLVPACVPPHKPAAELAPAHHRLEMARLGAAGLDGIEVSALEVDRGGVSYTVETLAELRRRHPGAELFLIAGAEVFADLPKWRGSARIAELARVLVADRATPGDEEAPAQPELPAAPPAGGPPLWGRVAMADVPVSSTRIRRALRAGAREVEGLPPAVRAYIERFGLYR